MKVGPVTRIQEVKFDDRRGRENLIAEESGLMANFRRDTVNTLWRKMLHWILTCWMTNGSASRRCFGKEGISISQKILSNFC